MLRRQRRLEARMKRAAEDEEEEVRKEERELQSRAEAAARPREQDSRAALQEMGSMVQNLMSRKVDSSGEEIEGRRSLSNAFAATTKAAGG